MKPKRKKQAKRPADLTVRNAKSYNRRFKNIDSVLDWMIEAIHRRESFERTLIAILRSKRLLTPAQCKMLEDAMR